MNHLIVSTIALIVVVVVSRLFRPKTHKWVDVREHERMVNAVTAAYNREF